MQKQRRSKVKKTRRKLEHEKSNLNKQILNSKFQLLTSNIGITLIALVVTIVVLLILAAITINLVLADDGIFGKAKDAGEEQRKAEILEKLNTAEATMSIEHLGKPGIREYLDYVYEKGIAVKEDEEVIEENKEYDIYTKDGYVFNIKIQLGNTTNDILINYKGTIEEQPPKVKTITVTNKTTNRIDVTVTVNRLEDGKLTYLYKKDGEPESSYKELKTTTDLTCSYTGLEAGKTYNLRVLVKNKKGEHYLETSEYTGELATGTIEQDGPTIWNSEIGTATIYLKTSETTPGITIQYQVGTELEWHNYTADGISNLEHNDIVQVRLFDGTNGSTGDASITIQDDVAPQPASITAETSYTITSGTTVEIKAKVTHIDNESGPNIGSCKWIFNTKPDPLGTDASKYTDGTFSSNGQEVNKTVAGGSTYYLHVLTVDRTGKAIETVSQAIIVEQKATEISLNQTSGNLLVGEKLNLTATLTPETTNNKGITWKSSNTNIATVSTANGTSGTAITVTAVAGGSATITVAAADGSGKTAACTITVNLAPTVPTASVSSKTTNSITVSANATDPDANNLTYSLYVEGDLKATSNETASGTAVTLTATGLSQYTTYNYYVTATDGKATTTGTTQTVRTYCSGTTHSCTPAYCSGGSAFYCDNCSGTGETSCVFCSTGMVLCKGRWIVVSDNVFIDQICEVHQSRCWETRLSCSDCGTTVVDIRDDGCLDDYIEGRLHNGVVTCSSCGGDLLSSCSVCGGVGSYDNPCDHSLYREHYHCTHNSNTSSTTHYYCDHNTAGKLHD